MRCVTEVGCLETARLHVILPILFLQRRFKADNQVNQSKVQGGYLIVFLAVISYPSCVVCVFSPASSQRWKTFYCALD